MSETPPNPPINPEEKPADINPDGSIKVLSEEEFSKKTGFPNTLDIPMRRRAPQEQIELKPDTYKVRVESYNAFKEALHPKADVVYHPANETDVSPSESFPESRVIYADINKTAVEALQKAGYEAHYGSATEPIHEMKYGSYGEEPTKGKEITPAYVPDVPVDVLIMLNPTVSPDIPAKYVAENGYALSNDYHGTATKLKNNKDFELVGIINATDTKAERKLNTDHPEDYWKTVETDEEFKKEADPRYYNQIAQLVKEKTGKTENLVPEFKKIVEDMRENPPPGVQEFQKGVFFKGGQIFLIDQLPRKKGRQDDIFVFKKVEKQKDVIEGASEEFLSEVDKHIDEHSKMIDEIKTQIEEDRKADEKFKNMIEEQLRKYGVEEWEEGKELETLINKENELQQQQMQQMKEIDELIEHTWEQNELYDQIETEVNSIDNMMSEADALELEINSKFSETDKLSPTEKSDLLQKIDKWEKMVKGVKDRLKVYDAAKNEAEDKQIIRDAKSR